MLFFPLHRSHLEKNSPFISGNHVAHGEHQETMSKNVEVQFRSLEELGVQEENEEDGNKRKQLQILQSEEVCKQPTKRLGLD